MSTIHKILLMKCILWCISQNHKCISFVNLQVMSLSRFNFATYYLQVQLLRLIILITI